MPHAQRKPCSLTSLGVTSTPDQTSQVKPDARGGWGEWKKKLILVSKSTDSLSVINYLGTTFDTE
jgi:hypothetical protein